MTWCGIWLHIPIVNSQESMVCIWVHQFYFVMYVICTNIYMSTGIWYEMHMTNDDACRSRARYACMTNFADCHMSAPGVRTYYPFHTWPNYLTNPAYVSSARTCTKATPQDASVPFSTWTHHVVLDALLNWRFRFSWNIASINRSPL